MGDSGSGGTKGLVPAPGAGDTAANKFLKADASWSAVTAGAVTALTEGSLSSVAQVDFVVGSTYDIYEIDIINLVPVTDNAAFAVRVSQSGSFLSGAGNYAWARTDGNTLSRATAADVPLAMPGAGSALGALTGAKPT